MEIHHAARDESFPHRPAIDAILIWTQCGLLTRVHNPAARARYHDEAVAAGWSTRELDVLLEKVVEPGLRAELRAAVDKV